MKYIKFTRKTQEYHTYLPKQFMGAKKLVFLVKECVAEQFPKHITSQAVQMADFVFADGYLIKNVFGPHFVSRDL